MTGALAIARWEVRAAARSRWVVVSSAAFAAAVVTVVVVGLRGARELGLPGMGPTTAGLVGLALLLPSLIGILLGSASIAGGRERGELSMILAQPVPSGAVVAGAFLGLTATVSLIVLLGFGAGLVVVASVLRASDAVALLALTGVTIGAGATGVALGLCISSFARSRGNALIWSVAAWFLLAIGFDLAIAAVAPALHLGPFGLLLAVLANPLESARVLALLPGASGGTALGSFGAYVVERFGTVGTAGLLSASILSWVVLAIAAAGWTLRRRDA